MPFTGRIGTVGWVVGAQWPRCAVVPHGRAGDSGTDRPAGSPGCLDEPTAEAIGAVLARHTADPGDCVAGLWEGWGWLRGSPAVAALESTADEPPAPPAFAEAVLRAPRLTIPGRAYLLFAASVDDLGELEAGAWGVQSPNLMWPRSRAWCLGTEVDLCATIVGGSDRLVEDLLALPGAVEADSTERLRPEWGRGTA